MKELESQSEELKKKDEELNQEELKNLLGGNATTSSEETQPRMCDNGCMRQCQPGCKRTDKVWGK